MSDEREMGTDEESAQAWRHPHADAAAFPDNLDLSLPDLPVQGREGYLQLLCRLGFRHPADSLIHRSPLHIVWHVSGCIGGYKMTLGITLDSGAGSHIIPDTSGDTSTHPSQYCHRRFARPRLHRSQLPMGTGRNMARTSRMVSVKLEC